MDDDTGRPGQGRRFLQEYGIVLAQTVLVVATTIALPIYVLNRKSSATEINDLLKLAIGFLAFIVIAVAPLTAVLARLQINLKSLRDKDQRQRVEFNRQQGLDKELGSIQDAYREIATAERGTLVQAVIAAQVQSVRRQAESCAMTKSVELSGGLHTTEPLLASMSTNDVCRFVHYCDNHAYMTGTHSLDFLRRVAELARTGRIAEVRRLLVFRSDDELRDPMTWLLAAFHADAPGYDYRLLHYDDYVALQREIGITTVRLDIGVFGSRYSYISSQDPMSEGNLKASPYGRFAFAVEEVARYQRLFDNCWNSHLVLRYSDDLLDTIRKMAPASQSTAKNVVRRSRIRTVDTLLKLMTMKQVISEEVGKAKIILTVRENA